MFHMKHTMAITVRLAVALLLMGAMLLPCGCGYRFNTVILSDTASPQAVTEYFFSSLKTAAYDECNRCLANDERIDVIDNTEYGFLNDMTDTALGQLQYELIGNTTYDATNAVQRVSVTALNVDRLTQLISEKFIAEEYDYLARHGQRTVDDTTNHDDVNAIIRSSIDKYAPMAGTVTQEMELHFVYQNNGWKIIMNPDLVNAIFGGKKK